MKKEEINNYANQLAVQMRKGMLAYCVLTVCADGAVYTSDIIQRMHEAELMVVEGTVYPLLSRLRKDGLLRHEWQESVQGPPRKYYQITDEGREVMKALQKRNNELQKTVQLLEKGTK